MGCELDAPAMQVGCGLRYTPDEESRAVSAAEAPVFFPDGFDGHGYAA